MPEVFVVKAVDDDGQPIPGVFAELQAGHARIGWSYQENLDLRVLLGKIERGETLDKDEREAKRCLGFLTRVGWNDYLLYPHQPVRGQCSVVQVTGDYNYSTAENSLSGDFRSCRPCILKTPAPVAMDDEIVPSQLRHRLGRPGRFSQVWDTGAFLLFLAGLPEAGRPQDGSNRVSIQRIHTELRSILPEALRREFSRADLSRRFCADLFERMGYAAEVQEGPSEAGSDVVVTVDNPLLPGELRVGVQVFAYEGSVQEEDLRLKLEQLLGGWEENALDSGVLLTTGCCDEAAKTLLRHHNHDQENPNRQVRLIEGGDLAALFLRYFPPTME